MSKFSLLSKLFVSHSNSVYNTLFYTFDYFFLYLGKIAVYPHYEYFLIIGGAAAGLDINAVGFTL